MKGCRSNTTYPLRLCKFRKVVGEYRSRFSFKHTFIGIVICHTLYILLNRQQCRPRLRYVLLRNFSGIEGFHPLRKLIKIIRTGRSEERRVGKACRHGEKSAEK